MSADEAYAQVIRQAAHDGVRALLAVPPDSEDGAVALRQVIAWLAREHGTAAVLDLAEELAVDLAEAFDALAAVEQRDPQELADAWFHDVGLPSPTSIPSDSDPPA